MSRDASTDTRSAECSRVFTPVASGSSASASPKWLGAVASDTTNSWLVRPRCTRRAISVCGTRAPLTPCLARWLCGGCAVVQACGGESGVVDLFHMTSGDSMRSFSAGAGIRSLCYHEDTVRGGGRVQLGTRTRRAGACCAYVFV